MEKTLLTVVVPALIALIGYLLTALKTRQTLELEKEKIAVSLQTLEVRKQELENKADALERESELRREELETLRAQVQNSLHDIEQGQHLEVLRKRLEIYPELYGVLQRHYRMWSAEEMAFDHSWAVAFLHALLDVNARHGVLFSQDVYASFHELRSALYDIEERLREGGEASTAELDRVDAVISGVIVEVPVSNERVRKPGLGSHMKDDLGSYRGAFLSARQVS